MYIDQVSAPLLLMQYPFDFISQTRAVYELYGQGTTYEELHEANRRSEPLWRHYVQNTSFRFLVSSSQHKIPQSRQREVIESFSYMGFLGKIDMKNPQIILTCFEECEFVFK